MPTPTTHGWSTSVLLGACALAGLGGYLLVVAARPTHSRPAMSAAATRAPDGLRLAAPGPSAEAAPVTENSPSPWADRWQSVNALASTPARTRALAALIEELARTDAPRALALAASVADWRLRDILRDSALRGWASVAPDDAGDYALSARSEDRRALVAAVLQGAAAHPRQAVDLAVRLCQADPEPAGDYGHAAIAALVDAGEFSEAVRFGGLVGTEKYPFLLKSAFFQWSRNQPAQAFAATETIADPALRAKAQSEVVSGWAWADAQGLAEHARTLPPGAERTQAMAEALPRWMEKDPTAALAWINSHDSGPEFDSGIAAAANLQSFVVNQPTTAMGLASDITDRALRTQTMRAVFRQWVLRDPSAARGYLAANPTEVAALRSEIEDLSP